MMIQRGVDPNLIESAADLAQDPERRIAFQADMQDYVDMAISSTLNLPSWGSAVNNEDKVGDFAQIVAKYAPRLRGLTFYPDGSRGGQPLEAVPYDIAKAAGNAEYEENSACRDGVCGL
jgi:ribonucleoside-diphosphate reductase alpha chain